MNIKHQGVKWLRYVWKAGPTEEGNVKDCKIPNCRKKMLKNVEEKN